MGYLQSNFAASLVQVHYLPPTWFRCHYLQGTVSQNEGGTNFLGNLGFKQKKNIPRSVRFIEVSEVLTLEKHTVIIVIITPTFTLSV